MAAGGESQLATRPDLVVVVIDTLRRDHLEIFGYAEKTAPFLAEFAQSAAIFERAHSTSSWTAPATASIFTGLYPNEHGLVAGFRSQRNAQRLDLVALPRDWPTLPETLATAGYATFGISTNLNVGSELGFDRGFERFERAHHARAEEVVATVRAWREELERRRPFFLYLHFNDVHQPYEGRPEFGYLPADDPLLDAVAAYDSEIRYFDYWLGVLFGEMGWSANTSSTAIMIVSDHGEEFMDHGLRGHNFTLHSEVNDVLILLAGPGACAGKRVPVPVSLIDVAPTLLEAAGLKPSMGTSGRSLFALAGDGGQAGGERVLFAHRIRGTKDKTSAERRPLWAVIDGSWKLLYNEEQASIVLFDVEADPREMRDLAAEQPEVVRRLRAELEAFRRDAILREGAGVEVFLDRELLQELEALGYAGHD